MKTREDLLAEEAVAAIKNMNSVAERIARLERMVFLMRS